jgi:hypothetical protein
VTSASVIAAGLAPADDDADALWTYSFESDTRKRFGDVRASLTFPFSSSLGSDCLSASLSLSEETAGGQQNSLALGGVGGRCTLRPGLPLFMALGLN